MRRTCMLILGLKRLTRGTHSAMKAGIRRGPGLKVQIGDPFAN